MRTSLPDQRENPIHLGALTKTGKHLTIQILDERSQQLDIIVDHAESHVTRCAENATHAKTAGPLSGATLVIMVNVPATIRLWYGRTATSATTSNGK